MRPTFALLFAALALPLALACSGSSAPTATDASIEDISDAEVVAASHLSDLTDEQRAALRAALQNARTQLAAVRARLRAGEITREEAMALARQIHAELVAAVQSILTPEQLAEGPPHRPGAPGHRPPDLGLTPEQLRQIHALREDLTDFARSLAQQVRGGQLTGEEARAQMRDALRRFNAAVCEILTADQQARAPFCAAAGG